jgi:hypothetical protein
MMDGVGSIPTSRFMSIRICHCHWCNGTSIPIGQVSCNLKLQASEWCGHCHKNDQREYFLFFCSPKCLVEYISNKKESFLKNCDEFRDNKHYPHVPQNEENGTIRLEHKKFD